MEKEAHEHQEQVEKELRELQQEASPALLEPQRRGELRVIGAYYHLDTGRVDFLDEQA